MSDQEIEDRGPDYLDRALEPSDEQFPSSLNLIRVPEFKTVRDVVEWQKASHAWAYIVAARLDKSPDEDEAGFLISILCDVHSVMYFAARALATGVAPGIRATPTDPRFTPRAIALARKLAESDEGGTELNEIGLLLELAERMGWEAAA